MTHRNVKAGRYEEVWVVTGSVFPCDIGVAATLIGQISPIERIS